MSDRRTDLAKIHLAKKDLGMDDDTYRAMLQTVAGVESAAALDALGRSKVLAHLRGIGWTAGKRRKGHPGSVNADKGPLIGKIEAILAERGLPWTYAEAMARRMCKVDALRFATPQQLHKIVAVLSIDQRRRKQRAADD